MALKLMVVDMGYEADDDEARGAVVLLDEAGLDGERIRKRQAVAVGMVS